jgi:glycosyltransferase involved in cell wall biosynthesis
MSTSSGVTVVVPVWDRYCSFLPRCVEAVLGQAAGERPSLVVVDNASRERMPPLPRGVEVVRSERRLSVGAARNLGLSKVATPAVIFCDADDRLLPEAVALLRAKLAARPDLVAVIGRYVSWNPVTGAQAVLDRSPRPVVFRVARYPRVFALANLRYNCFPVVGGILRTDAVRDAGGFGDTNVGEDWILGAQLAFRGPIEFERTPTFLRRVHEGSLWYRPHAPDVYLARTDQLRERIGRDAFVPGWVKAALPLLALVHRRDVARATAPGGAIEPVNPLLRAQGASE